MKQAIQPPNSAAPKGPYTPGIVASGPILYVAAQGPFDTEGQVVGETFDERKNKAVSDSAIQTPCEVFVTVRH